MIGNSFQFIGRLTKDPVLQEKDDYKFCNFTLARNMRFNSEKEVTVFPDFIVWNKKAEIICEYLKKGSMIAVECHYDESVWEDDDGGKHKRIKFVVDDMTFVGNRQGSHNSDDTESTNNTQSESIPNVAEDSDDLPF